MTALLGKLGVYRWPSYVLRHSIVAFALGLLVVLWLAIWHQIETERRALQRDSEVETANLAVVFEQNVMRSVGDIDRLMLFLRETYERSSARADWGSLIRGRYTVNNDTLQIAVTDAKGILIASSLAELGTKPIDLSDREHIRVHMDLKADDLFISKPLKGRVSGKWSVQLTRRYVDGSGAFGGVIVVSLDPDHLSRAYGGIVLGEGSGMVLVGADDVVRAGTGIYQGQLGYAIRETAFQSRIGTMANGTSIYVQNQPSVSRVAAVRNVANYPLYVMIGGRNLADDANWITNRQNYLVGAGFITVVILLMMIAAIRFRRHHESEVSHLARHDVLTGLANRLTLGECLARAYRRSGVFGPFALHLIDLDRFKVINDTHGHPVGDKLLKAVAERLQGSIRQTDRVFRLGGDEFALLQTSVRNTGDAEAIADRLCRALGEDFVIDGIRMSIGASVGIAMSATDGKDGNELVRAADLALYTSKADGRNCYRLFNADMNAVAQARRELQKGLRTALREQQLELHYQPITKIGTHSITGYEALLRWRHPERGLVSPGEFIPIAEETGLIIPIGAWVLRRACSDMASRPTHLKVAVNLSPVQFRDPYLVETVREALASSGLTPSRLEVEITESTLMLRDSQTVEHLLALKELGVRILMDDFGTGYSSLSYLQSYPINCIKIDRSFVASLGERQSAKAIVGAITALARSLGLSTIAEGVETHEQLEALRLLGCDQAQGFLFSRPLPAAEILPMKTIPDQRAAA